MSDTINISLGDVSKTAGTIRNINSSLTQQLEDIRKEMDGLATTWQSDASETIRANINKLAPKIQNYSEVMEAYTKFLDTTVQNYTSAESAINSNASAFK